MRYRFDSEGEELRCVDGPMEGHLETMKGTLLPEKIGIPKVVGDGFHWYELRGKLLYHCDDGGPIENTP